MERCRRCLMPGAKSSIKPLPAGDSSSSSASHDEVTQLELHLQRQLEEDVARIFDESIYSDLEVVCGKLKILTHSCILKARTHKFYHKLEAILHVNIGRNTFDEIYSFISDVYTECNVHQQEKEIIKYLNENLNLVNNVAVINNPKNKPEEKDEPDVYSTPNCVSPDERAVKNTISSSPSTELTKEYYALVPIEGNILDKELIEQDALSNAFQSINKSHIDINDKQNKQFVKPTSLFLNSSHISNLKKHSKSCDILRDSDLKITDFIKSIEFEENKINNGTSQIRKNNKKTSTDNKPVEIHYKKSNLTETCVDKALDPTYSPDSLVTDEPSSSSDYLSAAYAVSPGAVSLSGFSQLNVGENATKMENIITITDSGLENTGMPESLNSNKDVTLTDVSLTESTFHDMVNDDVNWQDTTSSALGKHRIHKIKRSTSLNSPISGTSTGKVMKEERSNKRSLTEMSGNSTKEEKQRQNEEIVIMESSSLSSETGSWESVFPPKLGEKELCDKFITSERHNALEEEPVKKLHQAPNIHPESHDDLCPSLVQKSPFKSTSCFIDAATLVDEDENKEATRSIKILPDSSRPVPCTVKRDHSPSDWSDGNDNDDSLEQVDNKDPDSIQKDLSPTIFEMTPITEDSLCGNTFETANDADQKHPGPDSNIDTKNPGDGFALTDIATSTSNNYTTAGGGYDYNMYASEISEFDTKAVRRDNNAHTPLFDLCSRVSQAPQEAFVDNDRVLMKSYDSSTISAASVEDHLSQLGNCQKESPLTKSTVDNIQVVVSAAFITEAKEYSDIEFVSSGNMIEAVTEDHIHSRAAFDSNVDTKKSGHATALQNFATSTPNNSMISVAGGGNDYKTYASEIKKNDITKVAKRDNNSHTPLFDLCSHVNPQENIVKDCNKVFLKSNDSPIISGGASVEDHLPQLGNSHRGSPLTKKKIENIPIVSGAYIISEPEQISEKSLKTSAESFWVVDMSSTSNLNASAPNNDLAINKATVALRSTSKSKSREASTSSVDNCKSRSSVDSDSSEKSTHKFYIDLSTLPDTVTPEQRQNVDDTNEKKNIFSMFIDLGDKAATVKEMPARLSSSLSTKKSSKIELKCGISKVSKTVKTSSLTSVTGVNQTDDSLLFEKLESLCNDPTISISEIISNPASHTEELSDADSVKENDLMKNTIEEEPKCEESMDLFVKLSDLDKPIPKVEPPMLAAKKESNERMTRSIPDNDWRESNQTINTRSSEIISSFHSENALSLNRLFPHLKNDFSRSMPGSLSSRTRSPLRLGVSSGEVDEQASDMSEMSSVQSSYCRSVVENSTTEDTDQTSSLISNCQSRLGQDLLRMFLEEIAPDVIVEAAGRRIKAHKCILSSRCQYFAGILSGGWVESAGNVIALPPFSFNVVHFALCHIYSGVSMIPDSISIVELATIADMLGLEGLKEAIMFTLKSKYCHHFHKPCKVCTAGALECFPLSSVYGLDDLYRKCLRWITKHFHKVWPTKAFATLPAELLEKCYQEHIVNLSTDNIVETVYGCGITVASLQNSRWCDTVARMCRRLESAAAHFAAAQLSAVLRATAALPAQAPPPAAHALDHCMAAAIEWAPPDEACRAYAFLSVLARARNNSKPDLISSGVQPETVTADSLLHSRAPGWRLQCEGALVRAAPRVVGTQAFRDLPADLRKRLRELGCIMFGAQAVPVSPSQLGQRATRSAHCGRPGAKAHDAATSRSLDIDRVRSSFVPYTSKPVDLLPARDARTPKSNNASPSVRTTKAQEERAKYNLTKTNQSQDRLNCKPTTRSVFENTKPRYLEPRPIKDEKKTLLKKPQPKMVSSSESSRNSSPNQARAGRGRLSGSRPRTADPSTDSLSESQNSNKYATYTKTKHTTKGSIEFVTNQSSKCHAMTTSMNNKAKGTKIPVYVKQTTKIRNTVSVTSREVQCRVQSKSVASSLSPVAQPRNRANERKPSGSLMNATKSSQAKMVPKIVKETHNTKCTSRGDKHPKSGRHSSPLSTPAPEIPIMERSGTFLKDEPMFGDKTTNIDIDE